MPARTTRNQQAEGTSSFPRQTNQGRDFHVVGQVGVANDVALVVEGAPAQAPCVQLDACVEKNTVPSVCFPGLVPVGRDVLKRGRRMRASKALFAGLSLALLPIALASTAPVLSEPPGEKSWVRVIED